MSVGASSGTRWNTIDLLFDILMVVKMTSSKTNDSFTEILRAQNMTEIKNIIIFFYLGGNMSAVSGHSCIRKVLAKTVFLDAYSADLNHQRFFSSGSNLYLDLSL